MVVEESAGCTVSWVLVEGEARALCCAAWFRLKETEHMFLKKASESAMEVGWDTVVDSAGVYFYDKTQQ